MSRILIVADSHGSPAPLLIAKKNIASFDKVIFLGDFFDHIDETFEVQKTNFIDTMDFKKQNPQKVTILLGNHDANYILEDMYKWQEEYADQIQTLIKQHILDIDVTYIEDKWIFSHAGVSKVWMKNILQDQTDDDFTPDFCMNFFAKVNKFFHAYDFNYLRFMGTDCSGNNITQNPLWIRPESLKYVALKGFNQAVGHSAVPDSQRIFITENKDTLLFLDSQPLLRNIYAQIDTETNKFQIKKFKCN